MSSSGPGSLDAVFEPPGQLRARFGWICGMTADAPFIERAVERFSRQSAAQRALAGRVYLGVLLDPSTPQIPPTSTPGSLHLAPRSVPLPFRLLHAKVALLGFDDQESGAWCVRLVVSTGNWTSQTLAHSLDLLWTLDLHRDHPAGPARGQASADIKAAAAFLTRLRARFNDDALTASQGAQARITRGNIDALDGWVNGMTPSAGAQPRFLHNETVPLIACVPRAARHFGGTTKRNYVVMGSGFYGGGGSPTALPAAPARIVAALRQAEIGLLTNQPDVDLVVNPTACQGVATAGPAIAAAPKWRVIASNDPHGDTGGLRSLHAKFIFSANWREGGSTTSPWVYLGSGNLTEPGFLRTALPSSGGDLSGGNLEAGVVFVPEVVQWKDIGKWLPFTPSGKDLTELPGSLAAGPPAPERAPVFVAPPFAFLTHDAVGNALRPDMPALAAWLLWPGGHRTAAAADGGYAHLGSPPPQVEVAWVIGGSEVRAFVPVVDSEGRVAGSVRGPLSFEGLAEELGSFPDQPDVDPSGDDVPDGQRLLDDSAGMTAARASVAPLRDVMHAVELVAQRQTRIPEGQWEAWVARVEQALVRMKDQPMVHAVRKLGVNPLAALRLPAFRPDFCEGPASPMAGLYAETLRRIELAWGVSELPGIVAEDS